jgi:hypothetical protein
VRPDDAARLMLGVIVGLACLAVGALVLVFGGKP